LSRRRISTGCPQGGGERGGPSWDFAKVGRLRITDPPVDMDISGIDQLNAIRMDIGAEIGDAGPDRWLTIAFAADPRWAD
jgi:predicted Co/Zn/Cd cation transporter (cation efflux family)